jgi:hypothetical protein
MKLSLITKVISGLLIKESWSRNLILEKSKKKKLSPSQKKNMDLDNDGDIDEDDFKIRREEK